MQAAERKKSKEEKDFIQLSRPFSRLMTARDYDSYIETSLAEVKLRARISQLQEYLRYGIGTFKEAEEYEVERKQRLASVMLRSPFAVTSERVFKQMTAANGLHLASPPILTQKTSGISGKSPSVLDISTVEGADFLTDAEKKLCFRLQILPRAYLSLKRTVLKMPLIKHQISSIKSDTEKVAQVLKFLES